MPPMGFEHKFPVKEQAKIYALDSVATGIGHIKYSSIQPHW